jgi:hypothetical protein
LAQRTGFSQRIGSLPSSYQPLEQAFLTANLRFAYRVMNYCVYQRDRMPEEKKSLRRPPQG